MGTRARGEIWLRERLVEVWKGRRMQADRAGGGLYSISARRVSPGVRRSTFSRGALCHGAAMRPRAGLSTQEQVLSP